MKSTIKLALNLTLALAFFVVLGTAANAQATRTWVSGVGDDANPCSRTAPCKTFAGAISKTATGGEIDVLDPGGFGAVTITKSISIESQDFMAGVLVSGTNGIVISAPGSNVTLRGLTFEGLGTGLAGVKVLAANSVTVEHCWINNFTQIGIDFTPSAASPSTSQLYVRDTIVQNNAGASSGGIHVKPGSNVTVTGEVDNCKLTNNQFGLRVEDFSTVTANNTIASGNTGAGFIAVSVGSAATLNLTACVSTSNLGFGIKSDNNTNATVKVSQCTVSGNPANTGFVASGGKFFTFSNNYNSDGSTGTITPMGQQ